MSFAKYFKKCLNQFTNFYSGLSKFIVVISYVRKRTANHAMDIILQALTIHLYLIDKKVSESHAIALLI